jgi:hypothetical protein
MVGRTSVSVVPGELTGFGKWPRFKESGAQG